MSSIDLTEDDVETSPRNSISYDIKDEHNRPCRIIKRSRKKKGKVLVEYENREQKWIFKYYYPKLVFRSLISHSSDDPTTPIRYRIVGIGRVKNEEADMPDPDDTFIVQRIDEADQPVGERRYHPMLSLRLETKPEKFAAERELRRKQDLAYEESMRKDMAALSSPAKSPSATRPSSPSHSASPSSSRPSKEEIRRLRLKALQKRKRSIMEEERQDGKKKMKKRREYNRLLRRLLK